MPENSQQIVEHLFRTEYGKLVAIVTRMLGTSHLQLAEDIVQETLIAALDHWAAGPIPDRPAAWLIQVAKRKTLNEIKRRKMIEAHHQTGLGGPDAVFEMDTILGEHEIKDSQLRMIFTCCHPALAVESQIALTLKVLCGFGIREVAHALLTTESTINKRLYRAKTRIRETRLPFTIPQGPELERRLEAVSLTLYLLFNEGYHATHSDTVIRRELCLEAIRLTQLLIDQFQENPQLCALLSLMCFHTARFDARIDDRGAIVLLEDQDRKLWNPELIQIGMQYLQKSTQTDTLSAYHLEAGIGAEHCMAKSFESTDWQSIYDRYLLLEQVKPNPIITLNLAIIQSQLEGIETSLHLLNKLTHHPALKTYHLLPATQGIFHIKLGQYQRAIPYLEKALRLTSSATEIQFITQKLLMCKEQAPD